MEPPRVLHFLEVIFVFSALDLDDREPRVIDEVCRKDRVNSFTFPVVTALRGDTRNLIIYSAHRL